MTGVPEHDFTRSVRLVRRSRIVRRVSAGLAVLAAVPLALLGTGTLSIPSAAPTGETVAVVSAPASTEAVPKPVRTIPVPVPPPAPPPSHVPARPVAEAARVEVPPPPPASAPPAQAVAAAAPKATEPPPSMDGIAPPSRSRTEPSPFSRAVDQRFLREMSRSLPPEAMR